MLIPRRIIKFGFILATAFSVMFVLVGFFPNTKQSISDGVCGLLYMSTSKCPKCICSMRGSCPICLNIGCFSKNYSPEDMRKYGLPYK